MESIGIIRLLFMTSFFTGANYCVYYTLAKYISGVLLGLEGLFMLISIKSLLLFLFYFKTRRGGSTGGIRKYPSAQIFSTPGNCFKKEIE